MRPLRATLTIVSIFIFQSISHADNAPKFISLPFICDANTSGSFRPAASSFRSYEVAYHQVLNYHPFVNAQFCHSGRVGFPPEACPGEFTSVAPVTLWSLDIVCRGGVMSAAQATAHEPVNPVRLGDYTLAGNSLVFTTRTEPVTRYAIPAGYGALRPNDLNNPLEAIDARILNPQIPIQGTPPGQPTSVRNILFDSAPIPQIALALLVALYARLAFLGRFHSPKSRIHPSRLIFSVLILAALAGLYFSGSDPRPYVSDAYSRAHQMVDTIAADQAKLPALITVRNGLVEPFTRQQYLEALSLMRVHQIPDTMNLQGDITTSVLLSLAPLLLFLVLFLPFAIAGGYHLSVKPPAVGLFRAALKGGTAIRGRDAAKALRASKVVPGSTIVDDSDIKHLGELAADMATDVNRRTATASATSLTTAPPPLPDIVVTPDARGRRRYRLLRYLSDLLERRERALRAELDAAYHARNPAGSP